MSSLEKAADSELMTAALALARLLHDQKCNSSKQSQRFKISLNSLMSLWVLCSAGARVHGCAAQTFDFVMLLHIHGSAGVRIINSVASS